MQAQEQDDPGPEGNVGVCPGHGAKEVQLCVGGGVRGRGQGGTSLRVSDVTGAPPDSWLARLGSPSSASCAPPRVVHQRKLQGSGTETNFKGPAGLLDAAGFLDFIWPLICPGHASCPSPGPHLDSGGRGGGKEGCV